MWFCCLRNDVSKRRISDSDSDSDSDSVSRYHRVSVLSGMILTCAELYRPVQVSVIGVV